MPTNWWEMPTQNANNQQSPFSGSAAVGGVTTPLPPLPTVSATQPINPFQGIYQGTAQQPPLVPTYGQPQGGGGGLGGSIVGPGPGAAGQGMPQAWQQMGPTADVAAQRSAQAVQLSPEGYQLLQSAPELADWLTDRSRLASEANRERLGGMSEQMLQPVEFGNETPGYTPQYWNARTQQVKGQSAAKFDVKRQIAEDNLASNRWTRARYERELTNIQDEQLQDINNSLASLDMERAQMGEQQRMARADAYMNLMQNNPVQAQDWWSANYGYAQAMNRADANLKAMPASMHGDSTPSIPGFELPGVQGGGNPFIANDFAAGPQGQWDAAARQNSQPGNKDLVKFNM